MKLSTLVTTSLLANVPQLPGDMPGRTMMALIDFAIEGTDQVPGARAWAGKVLERSGGDAEAAIASVVRRSILMGGAQGFLTNLGGVLSMIVSVPANLAGITFVQSRMVASIAHLRGYDLSDTRVRSAVMMTMLGSAGVNDLVRKGHLPSTPVVVATAPADDPDLESQVAARVLGSLVSEIGGKRAFSFVGRRIPILGGGVGAMTDGWSTNTIAAYAREQFVSRRPQLPR